MAVVGAEVDPTPVQGGSQPHRPVGEERPALLAGARIKAPHPVVRGAEVHGPVGGHRVVCVVKLDLRDLQHVLHGEGVRIGPGRLRRRGRLVDPLLLQRDAEAPAGAAAAQGVVHVQGPVAVHRRAPRRALHDPVSRPRYHQDGDGDQDDARAHRARAPPEDSRRPGPACSGTAFTRHDASHGSRDRLPAWLVASVRTWIFASCPRESFPGRRGPSQTP